MIPFILFSTRPNISVWSAASCLIALSSYNNAHTVCTHCFKFLVWVQSAAAQLVLNVKCNEGSTMRANIAEHTITSLIHTMQ